MPKLKLKDVEISYTIDDFTDPWKRAPWVLLHHSVAGSSRRWYAWVPALARSYKVLRYDIRGHGDSPWPASNGHFTLDTLVDDVVGVLDALDIRRVHFVGALGGGAVGLRFAHDNPYRIRTLTLVASTPRLSEGQIDLLRWKDLMDESGVKGWLMADAMARFGNASPELAEWYAEEGARTTVAVAKAALSSMAEVDLVPLLPEIKLKTLILAGEQDTIAPVSIQQLMAQRLPEAELKVFPGVGHEMKVLIPDILAAETLAFLKRADDLEELSMGMSENC